MAIHLREQEHHDEWASAVRVEDVRVREAFESPTAMENKFILREMGDLRGRRVLDVGAGLGESSVYFAMQGADVTLTDLSPGMVDFALRLGRHHGVEMRGVVAPAEDLDVGENEFDIVYCANLLHHLEDKERFLRVALRALKPGGRLFTWDPIAYNPVINVYRRMAMGVRSVDESPLTFRDVDLVRKHFTKVAHREFWVGTLALFLKYYAVDRVHPNADRYWKRIYRESPARLWWWYPLYAADLVLTRLPMVRRLAWNMVITATKPARPEPSIAASATR